MELVKTPTKHQSWTKIISEQLVDFYVQRLALIFFSLLFKIGVIFSFTCEVYSFLFPYQFILFFYVTEIDSEITLFDLKKNKSPIKEWDKSWVLAEDSVHSHSILGFLS